MLTSEKDQDDLMWIFKIKPYICTLNPDHKVQLEHDLNKIK